MRSWRYLMWWRKTIHQLIHFFGTHHVFFFSSKVYSSVVDLKMCTEDHWNLCLLRSSFEMNWVVWSPIFCCLNHFESSIFLGHPPLVDAFQYPKSIHQQNLGIQNYQSTGCFYGKTWSDTLRLYCFFLILWVDYGWIYHSTQQTSWSFSGFFPAVFGFGWWCAWEKRSGPSRCALGYLLQPSSPGQGAEGMEEGQTRKSRCAWKD